MLSNWNVVTKLYVGMWNYISSSMQIGKCGSTKCSSYEIYAIKFGTAKNNYDKQKVLPNTSAAPTDPPPTIYHDQHKLAN